ncbi:nuclear transport factor 2 family protein [Rhodococcus sp. NPDC058639]|uniref:nuclear transport factor 2 family protein n=1 Tax=Rhodococcus sp. NPDC058639 TaxID=3346570 RepID=UPI0036495440
MNNEIPGPDRIRATVAEYLRRIEASSAAGIADLYTDTATVEDPVGSDVRTGRDEILPLYAGLEHSRNSTQLLTLRIAGNEAAFHFRVTSEVDGTEYVFEPIDVMTFADDGRIASMRAFWSASDTRSS